LARQLMQAALQRFPGVWYLEVRESNAAAQSLYASLGFQVCGKRPAYYTRPSETGVVMKRDMQRDMDRDGDCHER
jgi:[ribosomal protein S18]-alanine N-acetyltransferase